MNISFVSPRQIPHLRILGRTAPGSDQSPLPLFWAGSGVEMNYMGGELWAQWETDYTNNEIWILVELNGAAILRMPLERGRTRHCLFRGLSPGVPRRVRIFKETQGVTDDPRHLLLLTGLGIKEGECLPLPTPSCRLEFIGDSLTSGEGTIGAVTETDWSTAFLSPYRSYARLAADALEGEFRLISQSGWGVLASWENDPHCAIPPIYDRVCGGMTDSRSLSLGAGLPHDFDSWQPDAVMIHLGTNDDFALKNPPYTDPVTGSQYALRDPVALKEEAVRFLQYLRRCNPNAALVWCYGMMGRDSSEIFEGTVEEYRRCSGDDRAYFLLLPDLTPETTGSLQHPGFAGHLAAAGVLTSFLKTIL